MLRVQCDSGRFSPSLSNPVCLHRFLLLECVDAFVHVRLKMLSEYTERTQIWPAEGFQIAECYRFL